jgi:PAS domain S-box-containing protein
MMSAHDDVLQAAIDQAAVGMALRDMHGNWLRVNQKLCDMLGYSAEEFLKLPQSALTPSGERRESSTLNERMRQSGSGPYSRERRYLRKDGAALDATVTISAVEDARGTRNHLLVVIQDITDRKATELELARYRDNLEELVRARTLEFEQAKEAAEMASHAKSVFLSNISHELRTPLNAILGFAQLMHEDTVHRLHPQHREWMEQVVKSSGKLLTLIEGVLDLSKIDAGRMAVKLETVSVNESVRTALSLAAPQAVAQGILLVPPEIAPGVDVVQADPARLQQVLTHLLSNAIKYNKAGGRVQVNAQTQADHRVAIAVSDTGVGMSESQCQALFTPFTRHVPQGSIIEGAGIGLALAKSLLEFMDGTITVNSTPDVGTTFTVSLLAGTADNVKTGGTAR